jgi:23S rRNA (pseudouridine1915-N3)-methyltransferase
LVDEECLRILRQVEPGDFVITLDEKGKSYTSNNLAELFIRQMNASRKRIVFVIGGAFGINEDLKSRSDLIMSFSSFTFTHQMIRLLLVEQVYRAMTIIRGESYHH